MQQSEELELLDDEFHKTLLNKKPSIDDVVETPITAENVPAKKINITRALIISVIAGVIILAGVGYFLYQLQPQSNFVLPEIKPTPVIEKIIEKPVVPEVKKLSVEKVIVKEKQVIHEPSTATIKILTAPKPTINPAIERGYEAFNSGNYNAARIEYEQALSDDPNNSDVLICLAIISVKNGQLAIAKKYYQQAIDLNPKDAVAVSGLIALQLPADAENDLQSIISEQPTLAIPHFVLGNTYAQEGRWADAQDEYFKAYIADRNNPDIIYNLAVSLDKIGQHAAALQYYNEAMGAAQHAPSTFNKLAAQTRSKVLSNDKTN
jgi:Tfp pilus assembly protein PilF